MAGVFFYGAEATISGSGVMRGSPAIQPRPRPLRGDFMARLDLIAIVSTAGFDKILGSKGRLQDVLRVAGHNVEGKGKATVPVDTGATRNSIHVDDSNIGKLEVIVGPSTEYAPFLEFGTSRMAARPFMTPALESERRRFIAAVAEVIDG